MRLSYRLLDARGLIVDDQRKQIFTLGLEFLAVNGRVRQIFFMQSGSGGWQRVAFGAEDQLRSVNVGKGVAAIKSTTKII